MTNREPGSTLKDDGGFFADVSISQLDPSRLPIRLLSLDPYHVVVTSSVPATLETFRILLPGYRAYVDGSAAPISRTKDALLAVHVPSGIHDVVVRFVGTTRLWVSAVISAAAWITLLVLWLLGRGRLAAKL